MIANARLAAVVLWCAAVFAASAQGDAFVQYLAGVEVLRVSHDLNDEQKASYYAKLVEVTGVSTADAEKRIGQYINRPEQWEKVFQAVISLVEKRDEPQKE